MLTCESVATRIEKAAVSRSQRVALLAIADKLEPKMRRLFVASFAKLRSQIKISKLAELIAARDERGIFELLGLGDKLVVSLAPLLDQITTGVHAGAVATVTQAAAGYAGAKVNALFDLTNPRTAEFISRYNYNLITRINDEQREVVRAVVQRFMSDKPSSAAAGARQLRQLMTGQARAASAAGSLVQMFGLDPRRATALMNYRDMLETGQAQALTRDIGGTARRIIGAALRNESMTGDKIDKLTDGYAQRLMQQRASTIAHTEAIRAANMGSRQAWNQIFTQNPSIDRSKARRYWVATNDAHTREAHRAIVENNPDGVGLDEPFDVGDGRVIMYPGDPNADADLSINCRCTVVVRLNEIDESVLPPLAVGRSYLPGGR